MDVRYASACRDVLRDSINVLCGLTKYDRLFAWRGSVCVILGQTADSLTAYLTKAYRTLHLMRPETVRRDTQ